MTHTASNNIYSMWCKLSFSFHKLPKLPFRLITPVTNKIFTNNQSTVLIQHLKSAWHINPVGGNASKGWTKCSKGQKSLENCKFVPLGMIQLKSGPELWIHALVTCSWMMIKAMLGLSCIDDWPWIDRVDTCHQKTCTLLSQITFTHSLYL